MPKCAHTMRATAADGVTYCCDCGKEFRLKPATPRPTPTDPASEAVSALREAPTRSWSEMVEAIAKRCDLAVAFDQHVGWDTDGADALGKLLRGMATRLDGAFDTVAAAEADIAALRTRAEADHRRVTAALTEAQDWREHARKSEALSTTLAAELAVSRAALRMLLPFVDRAAGEGLEWLEDCDSPRMDAADLCIAAAEALGMELGDEAYSALLKQGEDEIRAARALKPEGASDNDPA